MSQLDRPFVTFVYSVALAIMLGYLLVIGKAILVPIMFSIILCYILLESAHAIGRIPGLARSPSWLRHLFTLLAFALLLLALTSITTTNAQALAERVPEYEMRLNMFLNNMAERLNLGEEPTWAALRNMMGTDFSLGTATTTLLGVLANFGTNMFLVLLLSAFLMLESAGLSAKVTRAFETREQSDAIIDIFHKINRQIGQYLAAKTAINIGLAVLSWIVMFVMGVDFALFWAVVIGLLNYIPYVGSLLGVLFPSLLSVVQFGDPMTTVWTATALTAAQMLMGNIVEPRLLGRLVNLSPFVVLVSLVVWGSLWGIPGAFLAVPMTSICALILAGFPATRWISVLLSTEGKI
ncbi:AI-2E family transporter [Donghicola sp. C2-DW-16]|uniref:AI-2E family transporter n=1 Tax=Donghicola mangrovi TaxID=2729614 RepID=A0ABX2PE79_9RHOB|nr:AI-2E family transporter [Donghicola mangrovi]NVO27793.1 AI-2E family transporter [Donghicola mangrovi]